MKCTFKKLMAFSLLVSVIMTLTSCSTNYIGESYQWKKNHHGRYTDDTKTVISFQGNNYHLIDESFHPLESGKVSVYITDRNVPFLLSEMFCEMQGTAYADKTYIVAADKRFLRRDLYEKYMELGDEFIACRKYYANSPYIEGSNTALPIEINKEASLAINQVLRIESVPCDFDIGRLRELRYRELVLSDESGLLAKEWSRWFCFVEEDGSMFILEVISLDTEKYYLYDVPEEYFKQINSIFE